MAPSGLSGSASQHFQNANRRWLQMTTVDRLGHVAIRVQDACPERLRFTQALGMRLVWKADDWCYLEAGEGP